MYILRARVGYFEHQLLLNNNLLSVYIFIALTLYFGYILF